MATYRARLVHDRDGSWIAAAVEFPNTWSRGKTQEEAVTKLREEIRYRIELCPCSGVADDYVQIEARVEGSERRPADDARSTATSARPNPASADRAWAGARPATAASWRGVAGCPAPRSGDETPRPAKVPARSAVLPRPGSWRRWDDR